LLVRTHRAAACRGRPVPFIDAAVTPLSSSRGLRSNSKACASAALPLLPSARIPEL
jgi:hypothetical protein